MLFSICTVWPSYSRWLSKYTNKSASDFVLSLNIPPWKLFGWFRRPQLWTTSDWQLPHDNTLTHASCLVQCFLAKHQITQVTQPLYSPYLAPCDFWFFLKLKSPLKGKRFQNGDKIQENTTWQQMVMGELYEVPRCWLWKGLWCHCHMYNISCIFYLLQ